MPKRAAGMSQKSTGKVTQIIAGNIMQSSGQYHGAERRQMQRAAGYMLAAGNCMRGKK
jgi:hypothetical protein